MANRPSPSNSRRHLTLFKRAAHGWYQFNPALEIRCRSGAGEELWRPVFAALNLPLIAEFSPQYSRSAVNEYLASAGMPACQLPIMAEREAARLDAMLELQRRLDKSHEQGGKKNRD